MNISTIQGSSALDAPRDRFLFLGRMGGSWFLLDVNTATGGFGAVPVNESLIRSGGYVGLAFATGAQSNFRNGSGTNPADYHCETPPTLGSVWHTRIEPAANTLSSYVLATVGLPVVQPFMGYELLIDSTPGLLALPTSNGRLDLPIPTNGGAAYTLRSQGLRVDDIGGVITVVLLNAHDLVIQY